MTDHLSVYVHRRRRTAAIRRVGWAVSTLIGGGLAVCTADRLRPLPTGVRIALDVGITLAAAGLVLRPLIRLVRRRFDPVAVAAAIERQCPQFDHQLVTAASPPVGGDLRAATDAAAARQLDRVGRVPVSVRPAVAAWAVAAVLAGTAAGLWRWPWLDLPDLARRLAWPTADVPPVTAARVVVRPGPAVVIAGRPLVVTATVTGARSATLHVSIDGRTWAEQPMTPAADGRLAASVGGLDQDARYVVTAGDAVSPTYPVHVLAVPAVVTFRVSVGRGGTRDDPTGRLDVPAGAAVTVDVVATVPLRSAVVSVGRQRFNTRATADPAVRRATFTATRDAPLDMRLTSVDGVTGPGPRGARVHVYDPADVPGYEAQQRAFRDALRRQPTAAATRPATRT